MTHGHIILNDGTDLLYIDVSSSGYLSVLGELIYSVVDGHRFEHIGDLRGALLDSLRVEELRFHYGAANQLCDSAIRYLVTLRPDGTPVVFYTQIPLHPDEVQTQNGWTVPVPLADAIIEERRERCKPPVITEEEQHPGRERCGFTPEQILVNHQARTAAINLELREDGTPHPQRLLAGSVR